MNLSGVTRIDQHAKSLRTSPWKTAPAEPPRPFLKALPWGVFALLYLPLIYWSGFALKAIAVLDFPGFYFAARKALIEGITPYGFGAMDDQSLALDRWVEPFVYPPPTLLAFWPVAVFSLQGGFIVLTVVSHLCLLGTIWLIFRSFLPDREQGLFRTLFVCICLMYILLSDAVPVTLNLGQINIIAAFLVCLSLAALIEDKPAWRVAWPMSVAILLKTYPVLLLLLLAARKRYRAAALTVVFYGVFVLVAALVLPPRIWTSWITEVLPAAIGSNDKVQLFSHSTVSFVWNQSVTGFFTQLFGDSKHTRPPIFHPELVAPFAHAVSAVILVATTLLAFRAWGRRSGSLPMLDDVAAFVLMVFLVAPVSWDHHIVFILPATTIALGLVIRGEVGGKTAILLSVVLCLLAWHMDLNASIFRKYWWSLLASLKFFGVMTLWVFFARRLYSRPPTTSGAA